MSGDINAIFAMLARDNVLNLPGDDPWPEDIEGHCKLNWAQLFPSNHKSADWRIKDDAFIGQFKLAVLGKTQAHPEMHRLWDRYVWYQSMHCYDHDWGIYIRESGLKALALEFAHLLPCDECEQIEVLEQHMRDCLQAAFMLMYLRAHFHHKVESLALRLHVVKDHHVYVNYLDNVYRKTFGTDQCLEESLACADMYRRIKNAVYLPKTGKPVFAIIQQYLQNRFESLDPPGARQALAYLDDEAFELAICKLQAQVHQGSENIPESYHDWSNAHGMMQAYSDCHFHTYLVLESGAKSILPSGDIELTCGTAELVQFLTTKMGYDRCQKTSNDHRTCLRKPGCEDLLLGRRRHLAEASLAVILQKVGNYTVHDLGSLMHQS